IKEPVVVTNDPPIKPTLPINGNDKPDVPPVKPDKPDVPHAKPTTLHGMLAAAKPGDTIKVPAGVYEETLMLKEGVTLVAAESGQVVVQTDGKTGPALRIENCKEGGVSGFVFQHSGNEMGGHDPWPVALVKS